MRKEPRRDCLRAARFGGALLLGVFAMLCAPSVQAGIDHEWALDQHGIWGRDYQTGLEYGVIATEIAGALWLGNDNDVGHTFWQSIDSSVISGVTAEVLKVSFSRARPSQGNDPNKWFQGRCCESFPSGEVTLQASFVTPFIARYAKDDPWIWALELLPAYDAVARLKSQAHWQTDVLAGWAIGSAVGYWTSTRATPISVQVLPRGLSVGFYRKF
ncbi:MAG TPA: phosphatase PAP2 family protein [Steroidobacteraceae bacterium]